MYLADNVIEGDERVNRNNWLGMGYYNVDRATVMATSPFPAPPVITEPAQAAFEHVLKDAGATLPVRDSVDARVVQEVRSGTGHIIKWVRESGGWPDFSFR